MTTAGKFYAVKRGRMVGVFRSWKECKAQIDGVKYPQFRAFSNITDALDYLDWSEDQKRRFLQSGRKNVYFSTMPTKKQQQDLDRAIESIKNYAVENNI